MITPNEHLEDEDEDDDDSLPTLHETEYSRFFKSFITLLLVILESTRHWMLCRWQVMSGEVCVTMLRIGFVNVKSVRRSNDIVILDGEIILSTIFTA
jgi:hypothetical protein